MHPTLMEPILTKRTAFDEQVTEIRRKLKCIMIHIQLVMGLGDCDYSTEQRQWIDEYVIPDATEVQTTLADVETQLQKTSLLSQIFHCFPIVDKLEMMDQKLTDLDRLINSHQFLINLRYAIRRSGTSH